MKNPILAISIAFLCGAFLGTVIPLNLLFSFLFILFFAIIIKCVKLIKTKASWTFVYMLTLVVFLIGGLLRGNFVRSVNLADFKAFDMENVTVIGEVVDVTNYKELQIITVLANEIHHNNTMFKADSKININLFRNSLNLDVRDILRIEGVLRLYEPMRFWGDFSARTNYGSKGVFAYINTGEEQIKYLGTNSKIFDIRKFGFDARRYIQKVIDKHLAGDEAALIKGILIGDKTKFSGELKDAFSLSGMSHIVAVSGMHISIFIMFATFAVVSVTSNRRLKSITLLVAIIMYAVIVGDQPTVMRSALMAVYIIGLDMLKLRRNSLVALMFATFIMSIFNPFVLHNVGFQLSFSATLAIILFSNKFTKVTIANAGIAAFLGTAPILAYYFNVVSLASLFTNILVSPLVVMTLVLGVVLCIMPFLGFVLTPLLFALSRVMIIIAHVFSEMEFLIKSVSSPGLLTLVFYFALILMLYKTLSGAYKTKKLVLRLAGIIFILAIYFTYNAFTKPFVSVAFLPQSFGDGVHIRTPNGFNILMDAGQSSGVIDYFASKNISDIDIVLLTNYQGEDIRDLDKIAGEINIKHIFAPKTFKAENPLEEMNLSCRIDYYLQDQEINLDGIKFKVMFSDTYTTSRTQSAAILKMTYGKSDILFLGATTEQQQEWAMEEQGSSGFLCDIVSLADHGSSKGYNLKMLTATKAKFAISTGGFSSKKRVSMKTYEGIVSKGIKPFLTYEKGAINFKLNEERIISAKGSRVPIEEDLQWH